MSPSPLTASVESVRRLAVSKQRLTGELHSRVTTRTILSVVRDLAYVQWDPVTVVAPSHIISLWSRLGDFRLSDLEKLLWREKRLFLHWTPMASLVLAEDYPLYRSLMSRYPESLSHSWASHRTRARDFLSGHLGLRKKMLNELKKGPLLLSQFEDHPRTKRTDGEWSPGSDVALMLFHLLMSGEVMVVGHQGNQNLWGLSEPFLPNWVERRELSEDEFEREAAQRALRALGTATPAEITYYFVRGRYEDLRGTLARLQEESVIHRVRVEEWGPRDERYVHERDVPLLESMSGPAWNPRMSLLPPFDNLIGSTARTSRVFGFDYVREQFLPKEKRRFGTYVLPILWGETLIGRIDPRLDKSRGELVINAVHAEPGAPEDKEVAAKIGETIDRFASFLGAKRVTYTSRVPEAWKRSLR
ncbi:MAG: winged helix-turn-helix domain-containing protein [Thermoplasmata archaeon]